MGSQELMSYGFFAGIIVMANVHGVLLCGIFLFHKRLSSKANRFLALAVLGICIVLTYEAADWLDMQEAIPLWFQYLPIYLRSAIPVGIFYFVLYFINAKHQLTSLEKIGFYALGLDIAFGLIYVPIGLLLSTDALVEKYENYLFIVESLLSIVTAITLIPMALRKVNQYQEFLYEHYSTDYKRNLNWLRYFLIGIILCVGMWIISFTQYSAGYEDEGLFTFVAFTVGLVIILFWIGYFLIIQHSWFDVIPIKRNEKNTENKLSSKTSTYYEALLALMSDQKAYENVDLTLEQLAEQLNISSRYLSQIIKEKEGKNLFEFVNQYRVDAVKEKLIDERYKNLTLMGIAMESGFNSRSTFHSVFKKFTGQTPSAYKKQQLATLIYK